MKKKISVLIILLTVFVFNCNAYAIDKNTDYKTCGQRSKKTCVGSYDVNGDTCKYNGSACVVDNYKCGAKKHCTCYDASSCPSYDHYGNECVDLPRTGTCIVKPSKTDVDDEDDETYNNYEEKGDVTCGNGLTFNRSIANITHFMVILFQIVGPVMLVVLGMIDLFKGFTSGKDDVIKKAEATFIKRLVVAALMFLVITIARFVIGFFSDATIMDCFNCFVNGAKSC